MTLRRTLLARGEDADVFAIDETRVLRRYRRRPWRFRTHALTLARLHRELHALAPPDFFDGEGAAILHLDLHPANVMLAPRRPRSM